ncbi:MAG: porin family protein [Tannerellaceae bacterium]|jgi:outer membrane protein X|nr:porin family protein [Tannerellaceae bacterium]
MNKLVKRIVIFMVVLFAIGSWTAKAQKGTMAAGLNYTLAFNSDNSFSGLAPKFQYYLSDVIRGEGVTTFLFPKNKNAYMDIAVYAHYLFKLDEKAVVYPIVGVGLLSWSTTAILDRDLSVWPSAALGGGIEYAFTDKISANAELKYKIASGSNASNFGWLSIGVAYKFRR